MSEVVQHGELTNPLVETVDHAITQATSVRQLLERHSYLQEARRIQRQIAALSMREAIHFLGQYPGPAEGDDVDAEVRGWVQGLLRARIRATEFSDLPAAPAPPPTHPN